MFRSMGPLEIGVILVIILIIFGVGKLPQVGGAIGKSIREFRRSSHGELEEEKDSNNAINTAQQKSHREPGR